MAEVYKAFDLRFKRYVAIKVLASHLAADSQFRERFESEMVTLAQLEHPNIAQIHDSGEDNDLFYMVLQFFPGGDLRARMTQPFDVNEALSILKPIAAALRAAHSHNIVHRDLKPANILIADDGRPVLSDFGIAKLLQSDDRTRGLTMTGVGLGSPEYMSPEQVTGDPVDARSDIYSFGIVFYQMLVGSPPFCGDTPIAVAHKHVYNPFPRPALLRPGMPQAVEEIILKCVARDPADRYCDGSELLATLESLTPDMLETRVPDFQATVTRFVGVKAEVVEDRAAERSKGDHRGVAITQPQDASVAPRTSERSDLAATGDRESGKPRRAGMRRLAPLAFVLLGISLVSVGLYLTRRDAGQVTEVGPSTSSEPSTLLGADDPTLPDRGEANTAPASLTVQTLPADAVVSLDGGTPKSGPHAVFDSLGAGQHLFRVERDGYIAEERQVSLTAGQHYEVDFQLTPIDVDALGTIVVHTVPDGANITLRADGRVYTGRSGTEFSSLPAGPVSVRVEKDTYAVQQRTVNLARGQTLREVFTLALAVDAIGTVKIQTNAEAAIYVDNQPKRSGTSLSLSLSAGAHDVRVERLGFAPRMWSRVVVEPGKTIVLTHAFPLEVLGKLSVIHAGPWANIFLDGRSTGKTTPNVLADVSPGEHVVSLRRDGFFAKEVARQVVVISGKTVEVDFTGAMERLPR